MPRAEQVVNQIRRCLSHYNGTLPDDGQALFDEYGEKVDRINARLAECVSMLRQGLRSEAIQQAELAPAVLNEAAALDFPEYGEWSELCEFHDLGPAPAVDYEAVEELNEAYPREQQLESLLRAHRRLALGRGPLRERIKILRRLTRVDLENPIWGEDLITFERARHKQIQSQLNHAWQRQNMAALHDLQRETCEETWLEAPPDDLKQAVTAGVRRLQRMRDREALEAIVENIRIAYDNQDIDLVTMQLAHWEEVAARLSARRPEPKPPVVTDAESWIQWVEQEKRQEAGFDRACRELEQALDDGRPTEDLERAWMAVLKFERQVPALLENRYKSRKSEKHLESSRRFRIILAGTVAALLVVGGVVGFLIYQQLETRNLQRWIDRTNQLADAGKWPEARKMLEGLRAEDAELWNAPEIQALVLRVDGELGEESSRRERFEAAFARAAAAGVETPDQEAITLAESLAALDEEKLRLEAFKGRVREYERELQVQLDMRFTTALNEINRRFVEIKEMPDTASEEAVTALEQLDEDLATVLEMKNISDDKRSLAEPVRLAIRGRLATARETAGKRQAITRALDKIWSLYNRPEPLAEALNNFAENHPSHPLTPDFKRSARLADGWLSVRDCSPPLANLATIRVRTLNDTERRITAFNDLKIKRRGPYHPAIDGYLAYLERAQVALEPDNVPDTPQSDIHTLLASRLIDRVKLMRDNAGKVYYLRKEDRDPRPGVDAVFKYINNQAQATGDAPLAGDILSVQQFGTRVTCTAPPQADWAKDARVLIRRNGSNWETTHLQLCKSLGPYDKMDPVLRVSITSRLVAYSIERDWPHAGLEAWLEHLDSVNTNVNWMSTDREQSEPSRDKVRDALQRQPDLDVLIDGFAKWERDIKQELAARSPVAVIYKENNQLLLSRTVSGKAGRLEVIERGDDGSFSFVAIGQVDKQKAQAEWYEAARTQPAGAIVYLVSP